jgi:tetratricopeptide (TPR) repeat protein
VSGSEAGTRKRVTTPGAALLSLALLSLLLLCPLTARAETTGVARGMELLQQGAVDEALNLFQEAERREPANVVVLNAIGAILCLKSRPAEAIEYLHRALAVDAGFVPAGKNLAMAEFELGRYRESEVLWRKLLQVPSATFEANLFLGMIASREGRHNEAVVHLGRAGKLAITQPRALLHFADSLHHEGDSVRALQKLELLPEWSSIATDAAASQGTSSIPLNGAFLEFVSRVAEGAGELQLAVDVLRKAILLEPKEEDHYLNLGLLCSRQRNGALALEILDLGLQRLPGSYRLLVQKGITLGQALRYDESEKVLQEAIGLREDHAVAWGAMAVTQMLSERMSAALGTLGDGVERFPEDFYLHYLFGFALSRSQVGTGTESQKAAESHLRIALRLNGRFAPAHYELGKALVKSDPQQALPHFEAAVRLAPESAPAKYQLARLYTQLGRRREADELMREVQTAKAEELEAEQRPQFMVVKKP